MKERPILMSGPMVRALLDGSKTQTRRVMKPQPMGSPARYADYGDGFSPESNSGKVGIFGVGPTPCPYGQPGDRLWVRETHYQSSGRVRYRADDMVRTEEGSFVLAIAYAPKWKPSIFMRREASRITLEVVAVRVERLQDISEADAMAEGVKLPRRTTTWHERIYCDAYSDLWESINGAGTWAENPFVWVVEFKRIK